MLSGKSENVLRWTARIGSLGSLLFLLALLLGEPNNAEPIGNEWVGLLFFPGGVVAGLLIAWWKDALGGSIAVLSLIGFYLWHLIASGGLPGGGWFVVLAAPGILFLFIGLLTRQRHAIDSQTSGHVQRDQHVARSCATRKPTVL